MEEAIRLENVRSHQMPESHVSLYHREGLIRYIMCCSQDEEGGFRDKPNKYVDSFPFSFSQLTIVGDVLMGIILVIHWQDSAPRSTVNGSYASIGMNH